MNVAGLWPWIDDDSLPKDCYSRAEMDVEKCPQVAADHSLLQQPERIFQILTAP